MQLQLHIKRISLEKHELNFTIEVGYRQEIHCSVSIEPSLFIKAASTEQNNGQFGEFVDSRFISNTSGSGFIRSVDVMVQEGDLKMQSCRQQAAHNFSVR